MGSGDLNGLYLLTRRRYERRLLKRRSARDPARRTATTTNPIAATTVDDAPNSGTEIQLLLAPSPQVADTLTEVDAGVFEVHTVSLNMEVNVMSSWIKSS